MEESKRVKRSKREREGEEEQERGGGARGRGGARERERGGGRAREKGGGREGGERKRYTGRQTEQEQRGIKIPVLVTTS